MMSLVEKLYKARASFKSTINGIDYAELNGVIVAKACTNCDELKLLSEFTKRKGALFGRCYECKECLKPSRTIYQSNRRARKKNLPNTITLEEKSLILDVFNGCSLTGSSDFEWDHFIPLSTGKGGSTFENMIPLRRDLNWSKNDQNAFEWFETNQRRYGLSQDKFNTLIKWLAEINGMTVEGYKKYVYKCHESEVSD